MHADRLSRLFDLALGLPLVLALLPLLCAIALAIRLDSRGPLLYREHRLGRLGHAFLLPKFRTLAAGCSHDARVVPVGDARVTRVGRFLRSTRLDELPQLFTVLAGHMRLVGPRPERPELWSTVSPELRRRALAFHPGLTSPASLRYLCEDSVLAAYADREGLYRQVLLPARLAEEVSYFESHTLLSDLRVLLHTLPALVSDSCRERCHQRVHALLRSGSGASGGEMAP